MGLITDLLEVLSNTALLACLVTLALILANRKFPPRRLGYGGVSVNHQLRDFRAEVLRALLNSFLLFFGFLQFVILKINGCL